MKINVIAVGTLKERCFREAAAEYLKRLSAFGSVSVTEISECRLPKEPSGAEILRGISDEGARIAQKLSPRSFVVALCVEGEGLSSPAFSKRLAGAMSAGAGELVFVIGGSYGLSDEVKSRADLRLSFSEMTFPHQLMRVILLEQLYRAFSIMQGGKYHK